MPRKTLNLPEETAQVFLGDVEYDIQEAFDALRVNEATIVEQLLVQPGMYAYWAALAEEANSEVDNTRRRKDLIEAILDEELRQEARDADEKVTENIIQRRILQEDRYQKADQAYIDAKRDAALFNVVRRGFEQRMSTLIAVNNMHRAEYAAQGRESSQ